jgi:hypothetical protein
VVFLEAADPRGFGELGRGLENPFFLQHRIDVERRLSRGRRRLNRRGGTGSGHGKNPVRS